MRMWRTVLGSALVGVALLTAGYAAWGQSASVPFRPDDCRSVRDPIEVLDRRRGQIEGRIAALRASLVSKPADDAEARRIQRDIRRQQEDLLEVLFASDCLRLPLSPLPSPPSPPEAERAAPPMAAQRSLQPPPTTRQAAPSAQAIEVTTYYATNRLQVTGAASPAETYGNEGIGPLTFGRATVTIPLTHTAGNIELPQLWRFERASDPSKHFVLKDVAPLGADATRREISARLSGMSVKAMLVYVHGYNMGFQEAAFRVAQLAHDLKFKGVPFFYSWPSANRVRAYIQDEETARLCESVFEALLTELAKLPVEEVYIVAHSMGNRIVGHGMQAYVEKGKNTRIFKELLLAAPDINADLFKATIAPRLAEMQGTRTTIYASSFDIALIASKVVHGFRRVGESSGGVLVYDKLDTVDASNASTSIRNFGHSYIVDSASVIKDLSAVIAGRLAARARGLIEKGASPDVYWQLPTAPRP